MNIETKFKMGEDVFFFTSKSSKFYKGNIVGLFLITGQDGREEYTYQIKYLADYEDPKTKEKIKKEYIANPEEGNIRRTEKEIEELFSPLRIVRLRELYNDSKKLIEGIETNIKFQQEEKNRIEKNVDMFKTENKEYMEEIEKKEEKNKKAE